MFDRVNANNNFNKLNISLESCLLILSFKNIARNIDIMRTTPTLLLTLTITFLLINSSCALFGRKKKNKNKLAKEQPVSVSLVSDSTAANDAAAATNSVTAVVTIGEYLEKYMNIKSTSSLNSIIINIIIMIFTAVVGHLFLVLIQYKSNNKSNKANKKVDVVLVGMGLPKKGMGWYHLTQLLSDARLAPYVNVVSVVEPFFMNPKLCVNVPTAFSEYVDMTSNQYGVSFVKSIDEVPDLSKSEYSLCLIAGRTGDNPRLFRECVAKGAKVIYLEKPGASSVQELQEMKDLADFNGVQVSKVIMMPIIIGELFIHLEMNSFCIQFQYKFRSIWDTIRM